MTDTNERPGLSRAEPPPIPNDSPAIADLVIADMVDRKAAGVAKYGVPLQAGNGRKPLIDLYQELLDAVVYTRQEIEERSRSEAVRQVDGRAAYDRAASGNGWYETWDELSEWHRTKWTRMAASPVSRADYNALEDQLAEARLSATRANQGYWVWQGDGSDDLDSMGSTMPVSITAGQLRDLIERETAEWRTMARRIADNAERQQAEPLPDVETLRQWMRDETPVFLTFGGGDSLIADGCLPVSRSIERGFIADVEDFAVAVRFDGAMIPFGLTAGRIEQLAPDHHPWLTSIGVRRDTVAEPSLVSRAGVIEYPTGLISREYREPVGVYTREQLASHVGVPVVNEQPWTDATDPIVETWVGKRIECMSAMAEPWTCNIAAVKGNVLLIDQVDSVRTVYQRVPRKHLQVRPVSEVAK